MRSRYERHLYTLAFVGVMAALVFVTNYIKINIPTPAGETRLKIANAVCLLCGMLFGGLYGGLASGIGTCLYDLLNGYASSALYSFCAFFIMAAVCGLIAHGGGVKGMHVKRNILAAVAGAATYYVIYCVRTIFIKGMIERGLPFDGALVNALPSMLTSFFNAIIAIILSNVIALPVIRALRRAKLLQKMEISD